MKNKIVRFLFTQICAVTIATSLTGCGFVGVAYDIAKASMDSKEGKESPGDTNYDDEVADGDTTEVSNTSDIDFPTPATDDLTNNRKDDAEEKSDVLVGEVTDDGEDKAGDDEKKADDTAPDKADEAANEKTDEHSTDKASDDATDIGSDDKDNEISVSKSSAETVSYLNADAQATLDMLDTDYNKVKWGVQYSPTGLDYLVVSIAPFFNEDEYHLIIGVTNLYNKTIAFDGSGYAKNSSGENIGEVSVYEPAIGPGNTAIFDVACDGIPTGEIHWDEIQIPESVFEDAYWESDWVLGTDNDSYLKIDYTLYSSDKFAPGYVKVLVLDKDGYIIDYAYDYQAEEGTSIPGTLDFFKSDFNGNFSDIALFANPTKAN